MPPDATLTALRAEIDALDRALVDVLAARRDAVARVAAHKRAAGLPPLDPAREASMLGAMTTYGQQRAVPEVLVRDVLSAVLADSRRVVGG